MDKYIIDEINGFEYELKGEQYYPTGRRIIDGVLTPVEVPEDDKPDTECLSACRHSGTCDISGSIKTAVS